MLLCFCASVLLCFCAPAFAQPETIVPSPIEKHVVIAGVSKEMFTVDLGTVSGKRVVKADIKFENRTGQPLSFKRVQIGCSCTKATVPETTLDQDKSIIGNFEFDFSSRLRRATEKIHVQVFTDGSVSVLYIEFIVRFTDVLRFDERSYNVSFEKGEVEKSFSIPIQISESINIRDVVLSTAGDVQIKRLRLEKEGDSFFIRGDIVSLSPLTKIIESSISVDCNSPILEDELSISVSQVGRFTLFPATLILSKDVDGNWEGSMYVLDRIRSLEDVLSDKSIDVEIDVDEPMKVRVQKEAVNTRMTRLRMQFSEVPLNIKTEGRRVFRWKISIPSGDEEFGEIQIVF